MWTAWRLLRQMVLNRVQALPRGQLVPWVSHSAVTQGVPLEMEMAGATT